MADAWLSYAAYMAVFLAVVMLAARLALTKAILWRVFVAAAAYCVAVSLIGWWAARGDVHWFLDRGLFGGASSGQLPAGLAFLSLLVTSGVEVGPAVFITAVPHAMLAAASAVLMRVP